MNNPSKVEYWDLFNLDGTFAKRIRRGECSIPPHLYHKTVEIVPTDKAGKLLVTRRALQKSIGGGNFEFPAGSVISGEQPYDAAKRELKEETGLSAVRLYKLGEGKTPGMRRYIYLAYIPDLTSRQIILQAGETMGYRFVTYDQWLSLIAQGFFELSRLQLYTESVFENIRKMVGVAYTSTPENPAQTARRCQTFIGTKSGLSGESCYHKYAPEDAEEEPQYEAFASPEGDEIMGG